METPQVKITHSESTIMITDVTPTANLGGELSTCPPVEPKSLSGSTSSPEKTDLALGLDCPQETNQQVELTVIQERLRQARKSFDLTHKLFTISGLISVVGIALLFLGKVPEGTVTTAGGLASNIVSVRCLKLTKDTNDRLDKMVKDLQDED